MSLKTVKLTDIADLYNDKPMMYPKGTIWIGLGGSSGVVNFLKEEGPVRQRSAAILPKTQMDPTYLRMVLEEQFPDYYRRTNQGINYPFSCLEEMTVQIHDSPEERKRWVKAYEELDRQEEETLRMIEVLKNLKQYCLQGMFPY